MSNQYNDQLDHWRDYLKLKFDHSLTLHNHYETMANFGATVQTGLFAAILAWHIPCQPTRKYIAIIFGIIWLLTHLLVRWQLRNRRFETLHYNALDSVLRGWANKPPSDIDLVPYNNLNNKKTSRSRLINICLVCLDLLWPYLWLIKCPFKNFTKSRINKESDKLKEGYPQELVRVWNEHVVDWVGHILNSEIMYFGGSLLMFSVGLWWILCKF